MCSTSCNRTLERISKRNREPWSIFIALGNTVEAFLYFVLLTISGSEIPPLFERNWSAFSYVYLWISIGASNMEKRRNEFVWKNLMLLKVGQLVQLNSGAEKHQIDKWIFFFLYLTSFVIDEISVGTVLKITTTLWWLRARGNKEFYRKNSWRQIRFI